jgi:hypothetical protein
MTLMTVGAAVRHGAADIAPTGHFGEWPVTSTGTRSLARLTQFVRMFTPVAAEGRCSR